VVDAHGIVGRDGSVEEAPLRLAGVLGAELLEDLFALPEGEDFAFERGEIGLRLDLGKRHGERTSDGNG